MVATRSLSGEWAGARLANTGHWKTKWLLQTQHALEYPACASHRRAGAARLVGQAARYTCRQAVVMFGPFLMQSNRICGTGYTLSQLKLNLSMTPSLATHRLPPLSTKYTASVPGARARAAPGEIWTTSSILSRWMSSRMSSQVRKRLL